jgi:hypothetical protein
MQWSSLDIQGGAPCRVQKDRLSMIWNACVWHQTACNWWATLVTPPCSGISFVWRMYGPQKPNEAWPRILGKVVSRRHRGCGRSISTSAAEISSHPRGCLTCWFALLYRPEPRSKVASRMHRTALSQSRSTRRRPFRDRRDRRLGSFPDDS